MNIEDIIRMAREAGLPEAWISETGVLKWSDLERFAAIVVEAEREACAKLVEDQDTYGDVVGGWFELLAEKIRARGNT